MMDNINDINRLEDVQRRATRIEPLKGMTYEERRRILNLPTLAEKRRKGDLLKCLKLQI